MRIPVLQLAINATKPFDHHVALGAQLAPLRERGVLVAASGNVVHNLRAIDWSQPEAGFDWNRRFDDDAAELMTASPADAAGLVDHPDYRLAAPTPDHFIPLLYVAGLAAAGGETAHVLIDGYAMGSLSMVSYALGCDALEAQAGAGAPICPTCPPTRQTFDFESAPGGGRRRSSYTAHNERTRTRSPSPFALHTSRGDGRPGGAISTARGVVNPIARHIAPRR